MAAPGKRELLNRAENYVSTWNAGDKDAWVANWRSVLNGEIRMLDPVGTPEKIGFEEACLQAYDMFQPAVKFRIQPGTLFVCDNEVAWLLENHIGRLDSGQIEYSIETYRFDDDGSVTVRTYYRVPTHQDKALGDIFKEYQPQHEQGL